MKHLKSVLMVLAVFSMNSPLAYAVQSHAGHGGGGDGHRKGGCHKPKISRFKPKHLTEVAPGSDFSVWVSGVKNPDNIKVMVKKEPVEVTKEDKGSFYLVKGKLPATVKGTVARIHVTAASVTGNTSAKCNTADGWLLKITE